MNVVGVSVAHSEYRVGIVINARQGNQRPMVREPYGVRLWRDAVLHFDAHLNLYRGQRTPAICPAVSSGIIRVEAQLVDHRALGVRYRMRPPDMGIEAQTDTGGAN